jgi:hypothetical protein
MSRLSVSNAASSAGDSAPCPEANDPVNATQRNGTVVASAEPAAPPSEAEPSPGSTMQRAEQLADRFTENVSWLGEKLRYAAARTREAVSDFWAEVQNVRRGDK